jgi:epoxyqueuosine reductase
MNEVDIKNLTAGIRARTAELGFDLFGIAAPGPMPERAEILEKWCAEGMNDKMSYLERNSDKRFNPALLMPEVKSIIVTGLSYYSDLKQQDPAAPLLSRYAYGTNYHDVIRSKMEKLLEFIKQEYPHITGKIFIDSGPVAEKAWAREAGLGWQGKHSIVINRNIGSFFFIGLMMLDIILEYDKPHSEDFCGECRLCIEECPTGAINTNRTIDARRCIANLTIENRGPIPEEFIPSLGGRVYGCDKCQEVCPWNKGVENKGHPEFQINDIVAALSVKEWEELTEEQFNVLFRNTALERVKYDNLKRNISAAIRSKNINLS